MNTLHNGFISRMYLNAHPSTFLLHDVSVWRPWFCSYLSQQNSTFEVTGRNSTNRMTGYDEIMHSVKVATRDTAACVFSNKGSPEMNDSLSLQCAHRQLSLCLVASTLGVQVTLAVFIRKTFHEANMCIQFMGLKM